MDVCVCVCAPHPVLSLYPGIRATLPVFLTDPLARHASSQLAQLINCQATLIQHAGTLSLVVSALCAARKDGWKHANSKL